jgi:hypothetical protein
MPWDRPVVTRLLTAVMLASVGGFLFAANGCAWQKRRGIRPAQPRWK